MINQKPDRQNDSYKMTSIDTLPKPTSLELARTIAEAADERKAGDIVLLGVAEVSYLADYFAIATGFSQTQVRAISDSIEQKVLEKYNLHPLRTEGKSQGNWILQDYGDVIVHILLPEEREYYNLEAFWGHAKRINFSVTSEKVGE